MANPKKPLLLLLHRRRRPLSTDDRKSFSHCVAISLSFSLTLLVVASSKACKQALDRRPPQQQPRLDTIRQLSLNPNHLFFPLFLKRFKQVANHLARACEKVRCSTEASLFLKNPPSFSLPQTHTNTRTHRLVESSNPRELLAQAATLVTTKLIILRDHTVGGL